MTTCTPLPGDRVEVGGEHRGERLALTGLHLRDVAQVQRRAAHQLHGEVALADRAHRGLAGHGERLGQQLVQALAVGVPGAELVGLRAQLGVGELLDLGLERVDVRGDPSQPLHQLRLTGAEQAGKQRHGRPHSRSRSGRTCELPGPGTEAPVSHQVANTATGGPRSAWIRRTAPPGSGQCDEADHAVVVALAPVDDRRCAALGVGEQVEVVSDAAPCATARRRRSSGARCAPCGGRCGRDGARRTRLGVRRAASVSTSTEPFTRSGESSSSASSASRGPGTSTSTSPGASSSSV